MTKIFDSIVKKLQEDFNVQKRALIPKTFQGPSIDWGKTATHPSGFKGDTSNPGSMQILFSIPIKKKKKKKSANVLKKRVASNRVRR
jgi:hypothetical protein